MTSTRSAPTQTQMRTEPRFDLWEASLDTSEAAAFVVDPVDNRIVQFSQGALRLTGLGAIDMARLRASDLFPRQMTQLTSFTLECQELGQAWSNTLVLARTDDSTIAVEIHASMLRRRDREWLLLICMDEKRNQARRARVDVDRRNRGTRGPRPAYDAVFRELERGNQLILQAAGEGIYGVDALGAITFLNEAAERMLGYDAAEALGRHAHSLIHHSHANGDPYPNKACPIYAAFKDRRIYRVDTEVFWRKDGSPFPVEYTSTPINEQGRALGAVVVFRDVSEQRKARADLERALDEVRELKHRLELENAYLQDELLEGGNHHEIIGSSEAVRRTLHAIELVAPSEATVLITGESGTGKELVARAIHHASPRSTRPLIRVNCAAIARELFESEFFGHLRGAFTGAVADRVGRFELADGGTIFLDEVGEIPVELQGKLLRVLQERQFERVGDPRTRTVDVRVIAATNRDLHAEVQARRFREDLYFRLNVFPLALPPLRERLDDIALLASRFMRRICQRMNKPELPISLADLARLKAYAWPGNIRELENLIERAVIVSTQGRLQLDLPLVGDQDYAAASEQHDSAIGEQAATVVGPPSHPAPAVRTEAQRRQAEIDNLTAALRVCHGRVAGPNGAARLLGLRPTTLYSRLARHGIDSRAFKTTASPK